MKEKMGASVRKNLSKWNADWCKTLSSGCHMVYILHFINFHIQGAKKFASTKCLDWKYPETSWNLMDLTEIVWNKNTYLENCQTSSYTRLKLL